MIIDKLPLNGVKLLKPQFHKDNRGFFVEKLNSNHLPDFFVKQINQSISKKNVFRGFHFQQSPQEQSKYVWVEQGKILDIVINIQPNSKEYKKYIIVELTDKNNYHLFIPKGFAHGFISLANNTKVSISDIKLPKKCLLIFGAEDKGLRKLTEKECDETVKIPFNKNYKYGIESLNVSNACTIALYEFFKYNVM